MPRHATAVVLGIGLLSLGACAQHTYAPGPGMSASDLGPDSGRCHLLAHMTRPAMAFGASGSQKFVAVASAAAVVGGVIGTAIHDSETYDDCMQAHGWRVADAPAQPPSTAYGAPPVAPLTPVAATPLPAPDITVASSSSTEPVLVRLRYAP